MNYIYRFLLLLTIYYKILVHGRGGDKNGSRDARTGMRMCVYACARVCGFAKTSSLRRAFYYWSGAGFSSFICLIRYAFSSLNCSSSDRSVWNFVRKSTNFSWFRSRISRIGFGLFGFATNTLNTWNASNWIFRDFSLSIFIMSFRLSGFEMYFVITVKLCRSSSSSPSSFKLCLRVT